MALDKNMPCALFLDIDGTLMKHGRPVEPVPVGIPEYNIEMIKRARSHGHKVFINTGRGYAFLPRAVLDAGCFDGFITGNGSHIIVDGKVIFNCPISHDILERILDYIIEKDLPCRFQGVQIRLAYDTHTDLSPVWEQVCSKEDFFTKLGDGFVSKITIDKKLGGEYAEFVGSLLHLYINGSYGEAAMHGCTKAAGIERVTEYLGIPHSNTIAMGDSFNDVEMLQYAAVSVATANADERIKSLCTYVTDSDVCGGVGKAIKELLFE